jgi:hypothetical protein
MCGLQDILPQQDTKLSFFRSGLIRKHIIMGNFYVLNSDMMDARSRHLGVINHRKLLIYF